MTDPVGQVRPPSDGFENRFRAIERELAALRQRGMTGQGRFSVFNQDGAEAVYIGPNTDIVRPDGTPQWLVNFNRDGGNRFLGTQGNYYGGQFRQYWFLKDNTGRTIVSDDASAGIGLATPWISFPMYAKFTPPSAAAGLATTWSYMTMPNSQTHVEIQMWEARVPMITHPFMSFSGVFGVGSGTATPQFKVKINGTVLDTFTEPGLSLRTLGPYDVSAFVGDQWDQVEITCIAAGSGANIACQIVGAGQRQSP